MEGIKGGRIGWERFNEYCFRFFLNVRVKNLSGLGRAGRIHFKSFIFNYQNWEKLEEEWREWFHLYLKIIIIIIIIINYADFDIYFFKSKKYDPLPSSPYFLVFTVSLQTSKYNGMNSLGMVELCVRSCISRVTYCIINQWIGFTYYIYNCAMIEINLWNSQVTTFVPSLITIKMLQYVNGKSSLYFLYQLVKFRKWPHKLSRTFSTIP